MVRELRFSLTAGAKAAANVGVLVVASSQEGPFARAAEDDSALIRSSERVAGPRVLAQRRRRSLVRVATLVGLLIVVSGTIAIAVRATGGAPVARVTAEVPAADQESRPRADRPATPAEPIPQVGPPVVPQPGGEATYRIARVQKPSVTVVAATTRVVEVTRAVPAFSALPVLTPIPPIIPAVPPAGPEIPGPPLAPAPPANAPEAPPQPPEPPPPVTMPSLPDLPSVTTLWLEAEAANLRGQMEAAIAPEASGEQAIGVPPAMDPGEALAELRFAVPEDGTYALWTRVDPGENPETLTFSLDDADPRPCPATGGYDGWTWYPVETAAELDAGEHVLEIAAQPDGTQVDVVLLTDDLGLTPEGSSPPPSAPNLPDSEEGELTLP